ncbi:conserved hypothetical protein [Treponema phagedenis]|uniref:Uncharacterized protein n=1 Tax=Treponema phagedenis TaxID=162 RepID=A0A0B7GY47_TREPH|nr:hypothetical protein HMPREF9554_01536 [Treponema phagedenis F0421]CEM61900.1 conserved hypothetical protein [Treponema phagedenis]
MHCSFKLAATCKQEKLNQQSEPPWTAVVPDSSDVLKHDYLQSFKTREVSF